MFVPPPLPETNPPACTAVSCWLRLTLSTRLLPKVRFGRWKTRLYLCDEYFCVLPHISSPGRFSLDGRAPGPLCSLLTRRTTLRKSFRIISPLFTVWVGPGGAPILRVESGGTGVFKEPILWIYAREPSPSPTLSVDTTCL